MDVKAALKQQYHAGLAMLRQAVERCPGEVWTSGTHPRTFWRIAYHGAFYTHLYLQQNEDAFRPWEKHRECTGLWEDPEEPEPYTKAEILDYIDRIAASVDATVDGLDLDSESTGFPWYKNMTKLSHQLMNLRHLQGHVGQLSEILMMHAIDIDWAGKASYLPPGGPPPAP
jgi:hypothetical protein